MMRRLSVPYGTESIEVSLAQQNVMDIIYPKETLRQDTTHVLKEAMANPVDNGSLREFLGTRDPLLCIVNDATRPTKTSAVLDVIKEDIRNTDIHFLVATGAHRAPTQAELQMIFGTHHEEYQPRIMVHDARDDGSSEHFGKTRHGNALWLNKTLKEYGKVLCIGSVEPHYFAGFTGGRKSFLPGIAAYRTIQENHKHATHPKARALNLADNPIHEEMVDCLQRLGDKQIFSVQMVLDKQNNICAAFTGSIDQTFQMAARVGDEMYHTRIPHRADVVVTIAQWPFDINLYQTLKAIEHGRMAVKENGILIVVSPCHEGLGPRNFARLFDTAESLERAAHKGNTSYTLGDHNAINLVSLRRFCELWTITRIPDAILERAGVKQFASLQRALEQAVEKKGEHTEILFLMNGCLIVPDIT
jgi:nickel-dependent lactate racemase